MGAIESTREGDLASRMLRDFAAGRALHNAQGPGCRLGTAPPQQQLDNMYNNVTVWVVLKIMVPFWVPWVLGAVL